MARGTQALDASRRVCRIWDRASIVRKPRSFAKRVGIGRSVAPRREFLLRETKGLGYIAHLLPNPGAVSHLLGLYGELRARAKSAKRLRACLACLAAMRILKRQGFVSLAWATPARCSTSRPRPLTDTASPTYAVYSRYWRLPVVAW